MATGAMGTTNTVTTYRILDAATATNSPPSGGSAGVSLASAAIGPPWPTTCTLLVRSTAGSGTMTVTIRLWGYAEDAAVWLPLGVGLDATKGTINAGAAIGETGSDVIRHCEPIANVFHFSRLYAEVTAIGGTSTAVTVELLVPRA